jgi:hypothetical protein
MTDHKDQLDQATQDRLVKLATMPVDLSRLEKKMADALPPKPAAHLVHRQAPSSGWYRIAAMFVLMAGIAGASYFAIFGVAPQGAYANSMTVQELHAYLLEHPDSSYRAQTLPEAQKSIDAQIADEKPLPIVDGANVESCCLVQGNFPLRAALIVERPVGSVTIIIAQGKDFAHPTQPLQHHSGVLLHGHTHTDTPMVMRNVGDLWMCVMGEVDQTDLADVAAGIRF